MAQMTKDLARLHVENIGGIDHTEITLESGVTVLSGRNATNRTSLLQAIMAGLGSESVSLKGDADEGTVTLELDGQTWTRELTRDGENIRFGGEPYLDDPSVADLFAFLLESNDARRTVGRGDDLRDIIMQPVDADKIEAEIRRLQSAKTELTEEIEHRQSLERNKVELEEQKQALETDIAEKADELEAVRKTFDELSVEGAARVEEELETKMETLQKKQLSLENTEFQLESQRESLESLEKEQAEAQEAYDTLDDKSDSIEEIRTEITRLREEIQQLESEKNKLQNLIQFNEELLNGEDQTISRALEAASESTSATTSDGNESVTDQLLDTDTTVCWSCGTAVERSRIEETVDALRELRRDKYSEQRQREQRLDELTAQESTIEARRDRRKSLERTLDDLAAEMREREVRIDELETEREELVDEIDTLEDEITALEQDDWTEVLSAHREVNRLEVELEKLENEHDRVVSNIEEITKRTEEIADLETQREQLVADLHEQRTRIERIEQTAIEEFNEHMETVVDLLEYTNIERIWVERISHGTDSSRSAADAEFRLHVIRSTDDGITYEDTFEHLSESERKVTGLVFALAGYLAHDVHESVPFMLLDSLEAIDAQRIAALIEYFEEYADFLVVALLPEDADALEDEYKLTTDI